MASSHSAVVKPFRPPRSISTSSSLRPSLSTQTHAVELVRLHPQTPLVREHQADERRARTHVDFDAPAVVRAALARLDARRKHTRERHAQRPDSQRGARLPVDERAALFAQLEQKLERPRAFGEHAALALALQSVEGAALERPVPTLRLA